MYHFYQPYRPVSNLYIQKMIDDHYYYEHLRRLNDIQYGNAYYPQYFQPPPVYPHLQQQNIQRLRQQQLEEQRRIDELRRRSQSEVSKRVDDRLVYESRSLNYPKRQNDILRQSEENLNMMNRIVNVKPVVSNTVQRQEWERQKNYANLASRYPSNWKAVVAEENTNKQRELQKIKTPRKLPKLAPSIDTLIRERKQAASVLDGSISQQF